MSGITRSQQVNRIAYSREVYAREGKGRKQAGPAVLVHERGQVSIYEIKVARGLPGEHMCNIIRGEPPL